MNTLKFSKTFIVTFSAISIINGEFLSDTTTAYAAKTTYS